eukprot:TRINITY_DN1567_c0_g2_i1.p1 TRINITY_DN1567_c0_g2~~TRINITY_DN1567_c0_g2_i1.p1  ORF type:complete len:386 (+),score=87.13 TRINITY_DN1567_c0_g2_i1:96-1160(+)
MSKKSKPLPSHIEDIRTGVHVRSTAPTHVTGVHDANAFAAMGYDNTLDIEAWKEKFRIQQIYAKKDDLVFDLVGVDAPIANAFRRILLAEVPTMAIEKVNLYDNTSIIQDEVLAHRIGLIPIYADPDDFKFVHESAGEVKEENSILFVLDVTCTRNPDVPDSAPPTEKYQNAHVYSRDFRWVPIGEQKEKYADNPIRPVYDDILVAKLRPGQHIEAEMFCEKGIGRTHAKWSPVATASYRLLPDIVFLQPVENELADELVQKCPMQVFDIEDLGNGQRRASVARPRNCSMCRECIREPEWEQRIKLRRVRDHFIFCIESVGIVPPKKLFLKSVSILKNKCQGLLDALDSLSNKE